MEKYGSNVVSLKKLLGYALTLCIVLQFLPPVLAEEDYVYYLGEVVVTADRERGLASPSVIEITSADIEMKNAKTVAEVLDGLPGVFVSVGAKNEPDIKLRGISQDKILVLIDGFPVSGPYYGYVNLNQIPTENIAKIKVIKGPASVLYGANFLGGVINIITKPAVSKPCTMLGLNVSEYDTLHYEFTHSQTRQLGNLTDKSSGKLSLLASGSFRRSDGFALSGDFETKENEDGGKRENSDYERKAFFFKTGFEPDDESSFALSFDYIDNEEGIPYHTASSKPRYWRFPEWKKWNLALMGEVNPVSSPAVSLRGGIFYDKYDNILKSYDDAELLTQTQKYAFTSTYDDYAVGGNFYPAVFCGDRHLLKGALHFKADVHNEQPDADEAWEEYRASTYSIGVEDEIDLKKNLYLTIGGSFDGFHIDERDMDSPDFYLRTNYDVDSTSQYWIALSQKSRFPTLHQLYSSYSGNLDLKEEKALNSELGMTHCWTEKIKTTFTLFANRVDDLIEREGKHEPYMNVAEAAFEGIETEFEMGLNKYNKFILGYTYLSAKEKDGYAERRLRYTPEHEASAKLKGNTERGLSYCLSAFYVGSRCWYDEDIQEKLSHYWLINGRISQGIGRHYEVFISVDNLLDENYEKEDGFPQPGRTIWLGMKSKF